MATKFDFKKSPDVNGTADKTTFMSSCQKRIM